MPICPLTLPPCLPLPQEKAVAAAVAEAVAAAKQEAEAAAAAAAEEAASKARAAAVEEAASTLVDLMYLGSVSDHPPAPAPSARGRLTRGCSA